MKSVIDRWRQKKKNQPHIQFSCEALEKKTRTTKQNRMRAARIKNSILVFFGIRPDMLHESFSHSIR